MAIGFGSQTLVKDVISGLFYLLDDDFRVGEYIQSGSYMGTGESFSLRSIRLRHHRGPIFTVPSGELGAVQNMSRDWAIEKFLLRLNFDADITEVKKLVKKIGADTQTGRRLLRICRLSRCAFSRQIIGMRHLESTMGRSGSIRRQYGMPSRGRDQAKSLIVSVHVLLL